MTVGRNDSLNEKLAALLLEREVEDFLVREAALLDEWRLDDWLDLFTDDARDMVPATDMPVADPRGTLAIINCAIALFFGPADPITNHHAPRFFSHYST